MKHNKLHGVAHNFADSIAGGCSFLVPQEIMFTPVFAEAEATENGFLVANFLTGEVEGAVAQGKVEYAIPLCKLEFPEFCNKNGVDFSDYHAFLVRFVADQLGNRYVVTVQDRDGRQSSREYLANNGKRSVAKDELGRRRPKLLRKPLD